MEAGWQWISPGGLRPPGTGARVATEAPISASAMPRSPERLALEDYPDDFIKGVLIGAWRQVHEWIEKNRAPLPF